MNLSDLLDVELYNDSLKMFNQAWEERLLSFGDDLGEGVLENLCERHVRKSAFMKHVMTLHQQDIVLKKEPRSYAKLRTVVNHILEHQQQNMLISQKERSRDRAAAYSSQGAEGKGQDCRSWMSKGSCSKGGQCSFEIDLAKKEQSKGHRPRRAVQQDNYFSRTTLCQKNRKVHLEKKIVLRVSTTKKENCSHDRECDYWHPRLWIFF